MKKVTLYAIKPSGQRINLGNNRKTIEIIHGNWEKILIELKQWYFDKVEYRKMTFTQRKDQNIKEPQIPYSRVGMDQYEIIKKELRMEFPIIIYLDHAPYNPIHVLRAPQEAIISKLAIKPEAEPFKQSKSNSFENPPIPITDTYEGF